MQAVQPVTPTKTDQLAFRALVIALVCALLGSLLGVLGALARLVVGMEPALALGSAVTYLTLLIALLAFRSAGVRRVASWSTIAFTINLTAGLIAAVFGPGDHLSIFVYLVWFFPLLVFNKLENQAAVGRWLSNCIICVPLLAVACLALLWTSIFKAGGPILLLAVYGLSYGGFALILNLITRHREQTVVEQEREQEAIKRLDELQRIFDHLGVAVVVLDTKRRLSHSNRIAEELFGVPRTTEGKVIRQEDFELTYPTGEVVPEAEWPASLGQRGTFIKDRELWIRRKDSGVLIMTCITTTPIRDALGQTSAIVITYQDVTRMRQIEQVQARLAQIVEFSDDAIMGKNNEGIINAWNKGAERMFGYTAEEIMGESITRLIPQNRLSEEAIIMDQLRRGEVVDHFETVRVRKDGSQVSVSLTISPIRSPDGKLIGASKIARDISERIRFQQQLQQSQKMDAIGQLTGGIAHDFNNLLAVIIGNLDLMERRVAADATTLQRLQTAQKAALRGADLTRRLLAFSNAETLVPAPTLLNDLIRNVVEMTQRLIGPEIRIVTDFDEFHTPILVDAAGLESALLNLAVNAHDAMPNGGTLTISTKFSEFDKSYPPVKTGELKAGRYASILFSDTGKGMSQEVQERAFEPFFTTKPRGKGTGLGLAMVYGFARQSHGTVRVYSEEGMGTTVTLHLPFDNDKTDLDLEHVATEMDRILTGRVLLVDDELDLLELTGTYLSDLGLKVCKANDGASALGELEQNGVFDLLITDIIMPGRMNGVELAQKAREIHPEIRIIYCSGFPAEALADRRMPLVEGPLLRKPFQRSEFNALVRRILGTAIIEP